MARATFTNEQLCVEWRKQAKADPKGSRGNVVRELMLQMNMDPENADEYRKVYNNVTQRVKQLTNHKTHPVKFPELAVGKKGARRTETQMANLQELLNSDDDEDDASDDEDFGESNAE